MPASRPTVVEDFRTPAALGERVEPLLPKVRRSPRGGRPRLPYRQVLDGIFYVLRTGCHWKAAPPEFGSGSSLHRYFQRWQKRGVFRTLWEIALYEYDDLIGIDWEWQSLDGTMTKAPLGGKKDGPEPDRPGQERGQAVPPDRGPRGADRAGGGRGQPSGHGTGRGDGGEHPDRPPRADRAGAPAPVRGQGVRLPVGPGAGGRLGVHGPHPGQEEEGGSARRAGEGSRVPGAAVGGGADA